jgi:catechol 2,3-dioxygenase-like lactoylglutathione lyase family enzyme
VALHHVNVRVDDLAAARDFYESVLGLPVVDRPDEMPGDGVWFAIGASQQLHVSEGDGPGAGSRQHFCLAVAGWRAAVDELRAAGVDVEVRDATAQAFVRDPSGNRIELNPSRG